MITVYITFHNLGIPKPATTGISNSAYMKIMMMINLLYGSATVSDVTIIANNRESDGDLWRNFGDIHHHKYFEVFMGIVCLEALLSKIQSYRPRYEKHS